MNNGNDSNSLRKMSIGNDSNSLGKISNGNDSNSLGKMSNGNDSNSLGKMSNGNDSNSLGKMCEWSSGPDPALHPHFLSDTLRLLIDHAVFDGTDRSNKVVEWMKPEDLKKKLNITLEDKGVTQADILRCLQDVIKYSVKTGHPYFINQLFSGLDVYGLVGQWVTDALNPSVYTYEAAPVFTLMEIEVLKMMASFVGYEQHDGLFSPGGSISILYGMLLARYNKFPQVKNRGITGLGRLVVFSSIDSHYSIAKGAITMGIGADNLILINVDEEGRMDVEHLKKCIAEAREEGAIPFMVNATAGTTVLGAYDPLMAVADVCQAEGLWMHCDASWGGGALISKKYKHRLEGIHRADSVTWNPHKLLAAPQQCAVFLTRHLGILEECNSASASYLFQKDKFYDINYDMGDKHLQCGRRADVLKFWTMWKAKGTKGLEKHIDHLFEMSQLFTETIRKREGFRLVTEPQCTNICFWYEPLSLRSQRSNPQYNTLLSAVAPVIKERMVKKGSMMISYQTLRGRPNFFRLVLQNSQVNKDDIRYFADQFEALGSDL